MDCDIGQKLSGVALTWVHYNTHLNNNNKTIYEEMQNFEYIGKIPTEIWSKLVIDGYPIYIKFIGDEQRC